MNVDVPPNVESFIRSFEKDTLGKIVRQLQLLETYGHVLSMPHTRHITGPLWELRIRGKEEVRLLYGFIKGNAVLVHGFMKKTQKTPKHEIEKGLSAFYLLTKI